MYLCTNIIIATLSLYYLYYYLLNKEVAVSQVAKRKDTGRSTWADSPALPFTVIKGKTVHLFMLQFLPWTTEVTTTAPSSQHCCKDYMTQ